ncbi:MAG: enoyl-CoA hydratase/isomerase family protein [Chloroflexi bacterium]|nr:enoyl-CoA hydratase/isomerase family protein [Chloroflexota bacterium]
MAEVTYQRDGRIAHIRLEAPTRGNAFTPTMRMELYQALLQYQRDDDAWMAVVSGDGPDFCLGGVDPRPAVPRMARERAKYWAGGYVETWKPTIAAVQGRCAGEGMALALACDLRIAEPNAAFETGFGGAINPPNVLPALLVSLVGLSTALQLLWMQQALDAVTAQRIGLVNRLVLQGKDPRKDTGEGRFPMLPMQSQVYTADGMALSGAVKLAEELLQYAPVTRNFQKETAYRSIGVPFHYAQELELGPNPYASVDRVEGNRAFVENRRPVWKNQ